jgi:hypothetical protein
VEELLADKGPASAKRRSDLKSDSRFSAAVRRTAGKLVALHQGNRMLNRIINDRGRYFVALFVLDLHFRRSDEGVGLTSGRLKDICVEQGICSPTRAVALLTLMKLGGYVEPASGLGDRRRRELIPTEKLFAHQRKRWRCHFSEAATLLAEAARAHEMLDRPELMHGLVRFISAHYCAGFRFTDHAPALGLFSERNGGLFVLLSMLAAAEPEELERQSPIPISISGLARSISASRAHVIKLLKDAEGEGLVRRTNLGSIILMPPLVHDVHEFFALNYLLLTHFAKITLDHVEFGAP